MPFIQIQFRRGTGAQWAADNPLLAAGELGLESDTKLFKIGDGSTLWNLLPYGGLKGDTGATGYTGYTGATGFGATGPTGTPGDLFNTSTTSAVTPTPVVGGSQSLTVGTQLSYIPGNSVVVVDSSDSSNRFEGTVTSYTKSSGALSIGSITNISGSFRHYCRGPGG